MFVALEEKNLKRFTGSIKKDFATDSDKMSESSLSNDEDSKAVQDGRWTRDEHHSFLKAMAIYGREVKAFIQRCSSVVLKKFTYILK